MRRHRARTAPSLRAPRLATAALGLLALLGLALPACDLGTTTDAPPVAGEWLAVEYVATSSAEPSQTVTLIPDQGWFRFISFTTGGYHEDTRWSPQGGWNSSAGAWNANDSTLFVSYGPGTETEQWQYELLPDDRLQVTLFQVQAYDFDDDGMAESATETVELVRAETNPDTELLDSWAADAYTFTSVADTTVSYDVIAEGGTFAITFFQTATFQYSETIPGSDGTTSDAGDFAATQGLIWLIDGNVVEFGRYTFEGSTLVITLDDAAWDFDDDGTDEPATVELRLSPA